jgi:hypothetical protein
MNLFKLAFGLFREAAGSDIGRDVINNMRNSGRKDANPEPAINIEALLAEHRARVDQSLEAVVEMVNAQNRRLAEAARRQRIWNRAVAAGLILTFTLTIVAMWNR